MRHMRVMWVVIVATVVLFGMGLKASSVRAAQAPADEAASPVFYTTKVLPIFQATCVQCHLGAAHRGGLSMETQAGMMKGGKDGVVIVPGDPTKSLLVRLIRHEGPADDPMPMPQRADKLSDADIAIVERWVKAGAVMPADKPLP